MRYSMMNITIKLIMIRTILLMLLAMKSIVTSINMLFKLPQLVQNPPLIGCRTILECSVIRLLS